MDNIADLPEEVQCLVLRYYLGDSIALFSYLMSVFWGEQFAEQRQLVRRAFSPRYWSIHINPEVRSRLTFTNRFARWQQVSITLIITVAGRYSGLVLAIENMWAGALEWEMGDISISREEVNNLHIVIQFFPSNGNWLVSS